MKRTGWIVIVMALLLSGLASGQSIAEVARASRKAKSQQPANKVYDNDNIPTERGLSVVGPQSSGTSTSDSGTQAKATPSESKPSSVDQSEAMKKRIDVQKEKIDSLSKDLDITEREYRLRAVAMYSDAGNRLRNAGEWDKEDAQYKKDIADKQAALDQAKQQLTDMEEQERTGETPQRYSEPAKAAPEKAPSQSTSQPAAAPGKPVPDKIASSDQ